jgi:aryl carrier-like protein
VGIASHSDYECRIRLPGLGRIEPAAGIVVLERLLSSSEAARVAVIPVDWHQVRSAFPASADMPILSRFVGLEGGRGMSLARAQILDVLLGATSEDREALLQSYLQQCVAEALGLPPAKIDLRQQLMNIGVDSLIAIELKNRVELELRATIRFVDFLEGPTIEQLSRSLLPQLESQAESERAAEDSYTAPYETSRPGPLRRRDATKLLEMVDELPDSEVEALVRKLNAESDTNEGHEQRA